MTNIDLSSFNGITYIMTRVFKLSITVVICLLLSSILFSCEKREPKLNNLSIDPNSGIAVADLSGNYACSIVYGDDVFNAIGLADGIKKVCRASLPTYHYSEEESQQEILIGDTSRKESQQSLSLISGDGYIIKVVNRKLVIAGSNESWTAIALYEFQDKVLDNPQYRINNTLVIPLDFSMKYETKDTQLLAFLLDNDYDFALSREHVVSCPAEGTLNNSQGATGDGNYFYFALKNSNDTSTKIFKYDITSLKSVGQTVAFSGGHSNDLTYNPETNCLYLAHGKSQGTTLTIISCNNMEVLKDITIPVGADAITYNASRKIYAVSKGGTTLHFLDESFEVLQSFTREDATGYTVQGMGSDDSYIYFPMSGSRDNIIVVYDWSGKYVTTLTLNTASESETLFYTNGKYYLNFLSAGAALFELKPDFYYQYK